MQYQVKSLGEFCRTGSGATPSRSQMGRYYKGGRIPWVKSGELREGLITSTEEFLTEEALKESSIKLVPAGAILLAMYGATVGRLAMLGVEATTNQAVCHIVPDSNIADTKYIYHAISASVPKIVAMGVGGAQPNINQGIIKSLKISLPPLQEQRRISAILDKAESLRAKRQEAIDEFNRLAQAIFIEMFGDPATNPKGFPVATVGDILGSATYGTSQKATTTGQLPVLRMGNITRTGEVDCTDLKYVELKASEQERFLVKQGDILFNRTNSAELVGKTALYRDKAPMAYAGYLIRLRVNAENESEYLAGFMNTPYAKLVLRNMCKSIVGMANINAQEVKGIKILKPPHELQAAYQKKIEKLNKLKTRQRAVFLENERLFSCLQAKAFSGKL